MKTNFTDSKTVSDLAAEMLENTKQAESVNNIMRLEKDGVVAYVAEVTMIATKKLVAHEYVNGQEPKCLNISLSDALKGYRKHGVECTVVSVFTVI